MEEKSKIAIAVFGSRISPRFDCAPTLLVVRIGDGKEVSRKEFATEGWTSMERIQKFCQLGIHVLICGGIDQRSFRKIQSCGIKVFSWVTGEFEDGLSCYLQGKLASRNMMGPGGSCRGQWRFGRWRQDGKNRGGLRCRMEIEQDQDGCRDKD